LARRKYKELELGVVTLPKTGYVRRLALMKSAISHKRDEIASSRHNKKIAQTVHLN
jgi:hypothetical protein